MSPGPYCPLLGRAWCAGDRVVVTAAEAPAQRHGEIIRVTPGGALVRHDEESFEFVFLLGRGKATWAWLWSELEPEPQ